MLFFVGFAILYLYLLALAVRPQSSMFFCFSQHGVCEPSPFCPDLTSCQVSSFGEIKTLFTVVLSYAWRWNIKIYQTCSSIHLCGKNHVWLTSFYDVLFVCFPLALLQLPCIITCIFDCHLIFLISSFPFQQKRWQSHVFLPGWQKGHTTRGKKENTRGQKQRIQKNRRAHTYINSIQTKSRYYMDPIHIPLYI